MSAGAALGGNQQFDMDAAVIRLLALAANKRATRQAPQGDDVLRIEASPFVLCRIGDFPEPSPESVKANQALVDFADELAAIGGVELMVDVYDEAAERHGYRAVGGVSAAWDCHPAGWYH